MKKKAGFLDSPLLFNSAQLLDIGTAAISKMLGLNKPKNLEFVSPEALQAVIDNLHKQHPEWSLQDIKKYVQVLATFAPHVLQTPAVTESLVGQFISYGGVDPQTLQSLIKSESYIAKTEMNADSRGSTGLAKVLWGNPGASYFVAPSLVD